MGSGFAKKKKEAKQMQQKFAEMQEKMKNTCESGTAGDGLVTLTLNGEHELVDLKIKPECVDPDDVEGLEVLIRSAYGDALKKIEKATMGGMPGGLPFGF